MKTTLTVCCAVLLMAGVAWGEDSMTLEQFHTLVATPGDTNALRAELAAVPCWKAAKCSTVLKFPDGRVFREEAVATTKTVGGKYIVYSMDSQYSKEPLRAVLVYDEKAAAIKSWGISGGRLAVSTVIVDPERKVFASSGTHGEFMEISVGTYSDTEAFSRLQVFQNGVLALTREVKSRAIKAERAGAPNGSQPRNSDTNRASSAASARR